jgi:hypothetical protein
MHPNIIHTISVSKNMPFSELKKLKELLKKNYTEWVISTEINNYK